MTNLPAQTGEQTSALATVQLSDSRITEILQEAKLIDSASEQFLRIKLDGSQLVAGEEIYPYNPKKNEPCMLVQIVHGPIQYQAKWFNAEAAQIANRPAITDHMCKSYYDNPAQARKLSEDGASCDACPFGPFIPRAQIPGTNQARCSWRGDLGVHIVPEDGELKGDEPLWLMTLPTTSMIEYRGTRNAPNAGSATDENFMFKLAKFAVSKAEEWGVDEQQAILIGLTAYQAGGVVAEVRLPRATNTESGTSWNVISLTPIHIERSFADPAPVAELEAAPDGDPGADTPF